MDESFQPIAGESGQTTPVAVRARLRIIPWGTSGFVCPYIFGYLSKTTGSYVTGVLYLSLSALVAAALILSVRVTRQKGPSPATISA